MMRSEKVDDVKNLRKMKLFNGNTIYRQDTDRQRDKPRVGFITIR
jgi:hypothetical protein